MGRPSEPATRQTPQGDAAWLAETLGFLAETVGGQDTTPGDLSEEARFGLANILRDCEKRAWDVNNFVMKHNK